jgi:hypothetical protein
MRGATILRAEQRVGAGQRRLKPRVDHLARHHILFEPKRRHEKAVDHVLGTEEQPDGPVDAHMQHVELAAAARIADVPHPLAADHVDGPGVGRRRDLSHVNVDGRALEEKHEKHHGRAHRPRGFDFPGCDSNRGPVHGRPTPVADEKRQGQRGQGDDHHRAGDEQASQHAVHPGREAAGGRQPLAKGGED